MEDDENKQFSTCFYLVVNHVPTIDIEDQENPISGIFPALFHMNPKR